MIPHYVFVVKLEFSVQNKIANDNFIYYIFIRYFMNCNAIGNVAHRTQP